jgi:threonine/homoserine/homoserine lactone efflux protein
VLRTLRRHLLLVGIGEVVVDAVHYLAVVLVVLVLLAQAIEFAF